MSYNGNPMPSDLERAKERLEELADYEDTKKLSLEAENAELAFDLAFAKALLIVEGSNPTILRAKALTYPGVEEKAMAARHAKAVWQARLEASRNSRSVLEGERSINADRRAIV